MAVQYVVINLDRSTSRMESVSRGFKASGRTLNRFPAIGDADPSTDARIDRARFSHLFGRNIFAGELGCFLSHVACLEAFLSSADDMILILEDDAILDQEAFRVIDALTANLNSSQPGWQCVNLSASYSKRFSVVGEVDGIELRRSWQFPLWTSALLWSRAGAKRFMKDYNERGIYAPIDDQVRYVLAKTGRGFSLSSPPVRLANFESDIAVVTQEFDHSIRRSQKRRPGHSWRMKVKRFPIYLGAYFNILLYKLGVR